MQFLFRILVVLAIAGLFSIAGTGTAVGQDYTEALEEVNDTYSGVLSTVTETESYLKDAEAKYKSLQACMGSGPEGRECQAWIDLLYLGPGGIETQDKVVAVKGKIQQALRRLDADSVLQKVGHYRGRLGLVSTAAKDAKGALDFMKRFNPEGSRGDPTRGLRVIGEIIGESAGKLPSPLNDIFGEYAKAATAFAKRLDALDKALDNARQGSLCGSYSKYADAQTVFERDYEGRNGRTCLTFLEVTDQFRLISRLGMVFADQDVGTEYYIFESSVSKGWLAPPLFAAVYEYYEATDEPTILEPGTRIQRLVSASAARTASERIAEARRKYGVMARSDHHRDRIVGFHGLAETAAGLLQKGEDGFIGFYLFDDDRRSAIDRVVDAIENTVYVTGTVYRGAEKAGGVPVSLEVGSYTGQVTTRPDGTFTVHTRGSVGDAFTIYAGSSPELFEDQSRFVGEPTIEGLVIRLGAAVAAVTVDPEAITVAVGEQAVFTATATMDDGSVRDVTADAAWTNGPTVSAEAEGSVSITAVYMGVSGSASLTVGPAAVEADEEGECTGEDEVWDDETGECTSLDEELDDVTDDGLCNAEELQAGQERVAELAGLALEIGSSFEANASRFYKEIYDQNANLCTNGIAAGAFVGAQSLAERAQALEQEITELATDLVVQAGICPDVQLDTGILFGYLSQTGSALGPYSSTLTDMQTELNNYGCDESEVEQLGDENPDNEVDPDIVAEGGTGASEVCGDGVDNDGDGLLDEDCDSQGNYNVAIILFDSGNAADDIFELTVSGQGSLGVTPEGGARTYPLALAAGDYVATVTVVSAPDNIGTYTISIAEGDRVIASSTGSPGEGGVITVPFTVGDPAAGDPLMMMYTGDEVLQAEEF